MRHDRFVTASVALSLSLFSAARADAACSTSTSLKTWGNFWVERNASGQCFFYAQQYPCGATGGTRTPGVKTLLATVGSTDPKKACENLAGYDTALATVLAKYVPGGAGFYECNTAFVDTDQDGLDFCIDQNDTNPRIGVKSTGNETLCDGIDNDSDGTVDDGFTACPKDYKRQLTNNLLQGDAQSRINLVEGSLSRTETDVVLEGPYGPLAFSRTYNSRRETNDTNLGNGWVHSFGVYLKQMPAGDDRWQVETPSGEMQYFRCSAFGASMSCAIDDHLIAGNLRRVGSQFQWYPADGSVWLFEDTVKNGRRAFLEHKNGSGQRLAFATIDANGKPTKIETANSAIYLSLTYDGSSNLDLIRINSVGSNTILDYSVVSSLLDKVTFASAVGTLDTDSYVQYVYSPGTNNVTSIKSQINAGTEVVLDEFGFNGSDQVTTLKGASKNLTAAYTSATVTTLTYNVTAGGPNFNSVFTHNGLWVKTRNNPQRLGGMSAANQTYDEHGRVTCLEADDSRMTKLVYSDSGLPVRVDAYGKSGNCISGGTIDHKIWTGYEHNANVQALRTAWVRRTSVYSGASDCSGVGLPANCSETKYQYVSSTDDRPQLITRTGYTRLINDTTSLQIRKTRLYYYGLDIPQCPSSGDWYTGNLCLEEVQDNVLPTPNLYGQTRYTYFDSTQGISAGLIKAVKRSDIASDPAPLTTTYSGYNNFGAATTVVDEAGVSSAFAYNGWNAVTSVVTTNGFLDDSIPPVGLSYTTSYSYNKLRGLDTTTLPKGNKRVVKYFIAAGEYGRVKAWTNAASDASLQEILRYEYNQFGARTEDKIIDSIVGSTPCADENCPTWEVRRARSYNALGQLTGTSVYSSDTADPPDATTTNVYVGGQLSQSFDELGVISTTTYDDQGRVLTTKQDDAVGGLNAITTYGYDAAGQLLTTTSPTGVVTRTEHDDFGQLVLERSSTRGDIRFEYDSAGYQTKRQRSTYNSALNAQATCYTNDWLGRQKTIDYLCDGIDWNFAYDGDTPSGAPPTSACRTGTIQKGRLSSFWKSDVMSRALCYHPNGAIYSSMQMNETHTWNNALARGTTLIYDLNGNLTREYIYDQPGSPGVDHGKARVVEYTYDASLLDRVKSIRHKLTTAGGWTNVTDQVTAPTYFPFGGFKTVVYANAVTETNTRDFAYRLTRRRSENGATKFTDLNLAYDIGGNITTYDDSTGYRHLKHFAAYDKLRRLRCVSRASIGACTGAEPWENQFNESFDYDLSGNRTNRRAGAFNTADDDAYAYVSGTDIIDKVTSGGVVKEMDNTFRGEISTVNQPNLIQYAFNEDSQLTQASDSYLGTVTQKSTPFMDRYSKVSTCNSRKVFYHYFPGQGGASSQLQLMNLWNTCFAEYPRQERSYIYLEGRPIAVVHSTIAAASPSDSQTDVETFWIHTDQLGTPVLVTNLVRTERWRWENDPFGRADPIEYGVLGQDVSPDDTSGNPYKTCCCTGCVAGCGQCTTGCAVNQCAGGASQAIVWTKFYASSDPAANNVRVHFSSFNVAPGSNRTNKDYVELRSADGGLLANLTGNLGDFWGPWSNDGDNGMDVSLYSDNAADGTSGFVIDKIEYTTTANARFVLHLRMPGQIADEDAEASYNWNRWYRSQDGRYISPDPIGLEGTEPNYSSYVGASPMVSVDPNGLCPADTPDVINVCAKRLPSDGGSGMRTPQSVNRLPRGWTWETAEPVITPEEVAVCEAYAERDYKVCRGLSTPTAREQCWARAAERLGACLAGKAAPFNLEPDGGWRKPTSAGSGGGNGASGSQGSGHASPEPPPPPNSASGHRRHRL